MLARDIMTKDVVTVTAEVTLDQVAKALLKARVSAVPVVDGDGRPIGVVSEWDLIGQHAPDRVARRDQWLARLAEGQTLSAAYVETTSPRARTAEEVMTRPVISVEETADLAAIGKVITERHVKRVFVLHDGRLVGVVSRADLARSLTLPSATTPGRAPLEPPAHPQVAPEPPHVTAPGEAVFSAAGFRHLVEEHDDAERAARTAQAIAHAKAIEDLVARLAAERMTDDEWHALLDHAEAAAQRGEKDFRLLRFPSKLCSDGGRMINVPDPQWPTTLRGPAADVYERWQEELKPRGFGLNARILEFPGGLPGDAGLTLTWGG